ncbi:rRNA pseudouridine synthase [Salipaludibacillus agaradhaerens]|nr:rRNA pseudouridine synthase [Salipaludibacillus agaradhaerens]MCR6119682.1 rRNA pseudouridine synthase [Salipaludibacillus agaradhaerens]
MLRADKLLASMGFGSRKEVKKLLKKGGFTVNEAVVKDGKTHVNPETDILEVFGERLYYKPFIYLMMNKPQGVVSATDDKRDRTVIDLLEPEDALYDPFPVGRLDKDTTGLLLLTNDGQLAHKLTSPKKKVDKQYLVHLEKSIDEVDILALEQGIELDDGYVTKPAVVELVNDQEKGVVYLTIQEGKFHQVKRMFQARGNRVVALKRKRIGPLNLDETLSLGTYRELTEDELEKLLD